MYNNLTKYKQPIFNTLKWLIVILAIYFIYIKLVANELLSVEQFQEKLSVLFTNSLWWLLLLLLFTDANLLLEISKWQTLVKKEQKISFFDALEQCLASLTTSIITPNRIGEYGAKALYFNKRIRKKILVLNLIGNLYQLLTTFIFGLIGIYFLIWKIPFYLKLNLTNTAFFLGFLVLLFGILLKFYNWSTMLQKVITYWKSIPFKKHLAVFSLSILRYLVFSHQFYFLLLLFGIEIEYQFAISLILSMYLLASIIPSMNIFDWAIKGSIAVWLFSFVGVDELTIITITTLMWLLNFGIPALFGSLFVLNFKLETTK